MGNGYAVLVMEERRKELVCYCKNWKFLLFPPLQNLFMGNGYGVLIMDERHKELIFYLKTKFFYFPKKTCVYGNMGTMFL